MSNFFISLGNLNKKLFLPFIYIIVYIIVNFYYFYNEYNVAIMFLEHFGFSFGEMMTYFIAYSFKYQSTLEKKKKKSLIKSFKDYFPLFLINIFFMIDNVFPYYIYRENESIGEKKGVGEDDKEDNPYEELFLTDGFEIIFITLLTFLLLKYKYYIHHIISTAIFFILCVFMDILVDNFKNINTLKIINSFTYILSDTLLYTYMKYLIDNKYYYYMDVLFYLGLIDYIINFASIIIIIIVQNINGTNQLVFEFFYLYNEKGVGYMVVWFMFGLFFLGIFSGYLELAILNELTPNYIILGFCLAKIPTSIMSINGYKSWIILIISIIQIFISLFYLEIFEYNFCSLNVNTKRNIEEREKREVYNGKDDGDNEIVIKGYDISEIIEIDSSIKEMDDIGEEYHENN